MFINGITTNRKQYDPALVAAGATLLAAGGNAYSQGRMNRASRQFAQEQSQEQNRRNIENWHMMNAYNEKQWGIQNQYDEQMRDNQRMYDMETWNIENEYNSPRQQMQRFQEAGLNPHMVTGSSNAMGGSISNSSMDTTPQRGSDQAPAGKAEWNPKAPTFDSSSISMYIDLQTKKAQQDLLAEQAKLTSKEADLARAKEITELTAGNAAELQFGIDSELRQTSVDARKTALNKAIADLNFTKNQDQRADEAQAMSFKEAKARIELMKEQAKTEQQKQQIQDAEIIIKKIQAQYGDGLFGIPGLLGRIINGLERSFGPMEIPREKDGTYKILPDWYKNK